MKGLIYTNFINYVEKRYDYELIDEALETLSLDSKGIYSPLGYYKFQELADLVGYVAKATGIEREQIIYGYGKFLFNILSEAHPEIVKQYKSALELLMYIEQHTHFEVQKLYPEVLLPNIKVKSINNGDVIDLDYSSHRPLAWLFRGLVEGCLEHFSNFPLYELSYELSPEHTKMSIRLTRNE